MNPTPDDPAPRRTPAEWVAAQVLNPLNIAILAVAATLVGVIAEEAAVIVGGVFLIVVAGFLTHWSRQQH
jgi:hypothetical protein